jgi:putative DNA primase/helicase
MADLTKILGGPWKPPSERVIDPPEIQLRKAMLEAGLTPPDQIWLDGKVHRFASGTKGKSGHGDKPGWYVAYADGVPAGRFGCWRLGVEVTWRADVGRQLTMTEHLAQTRRIEEAKAARDAEQARKHEVAASTVQLIWSEGLAASEDHPYLQRKGIKVHGARVTGDGRLMVPLYAPDGELSSLQYISADGDKKYHSGGATGGCYWWLGAIEDANLVYVAEGFATAATIHESTGQPVFVSYSASNLVPVTGMLRERMTAPIVIVADNDASGVGQRYAEQASAKYGARFIVPPIQGDANDYAQAGHNLTALLVQQTGTAITEKLKVVFGDQLSSEYEAPDELVEGLITIGSSVVVYGDSNSGKTFWALSVATAIASGTECYGLKTDPGLVVYLASEAPGSIRSRMQAIKQFYGCSLENLAMVPVPMNFYSGDQDAQDVIELVKAVEQMKGKPVRLIIGDTLARMSAGANENSGEDMGPVMDRFGQVATATGAAMMIIHHNGKDAARGARGWSGIRAHIDTEIEVTEKDGVRSASVTKQRELPSKGETIYFRLEVIEMGTTKFGAAATTCVAVPDNEASTTKPHKKPTKHDENVRTVERAWWASGAEERNGLPYVSRQALRDLLINDGMSERTAKNKTEASRQDGIICQLLNAGTLATLDQGWIFSNQAQASALLMQKNRP